MSSPAVSTAATLLIITFIPRFLENTSLNFKYSNFGNSQMSQLVSARGKKINKKTKTQNPPQLTFSSPRLFTAHMLQRVVAKALFPKD